MLCVLLAFFAIERRVAAYAAHNLAAATIAATGVQTPRQIAFTETETFGAPVLFLCILVLFVAHCSRRAAYSAKHQDRVALPVWDAMHLAVRPPPAE